MNGNQGNSYFSMAMKLLVATKEFSQINYVLICFRIVAGPAKEIVL
jgi:hypothetical protein